jgi:hypothetical protein
MEKEVNARMREKVGDEDRRWSGAFEDMVEDEVQDLVAVQSDASALPYVRPPKDINNMKGILSSEGRVR